MESAGPTGPWAQRRPVREEVHVHIRICLSKAMSKLVDVANEIIIADHFIQRLPVLDRVVRVRPISFTIVRIIKSKESQLKSGAQKQLARNPKTIFGIRISVSFFF